jgi:hypothetical protein
MDDCLENYSRYLSGRKAGQPPPTLLDYLPADALVARQSRWKPPAHIVKVWLRLKYIDEFYLQTH